MKINNLKIVEYIAYLILVRSMLRNSSLILLSPNEERILNYLAIDLFLDQEISIQDVPDLIPGVDIKSVGEGLISLKKKGYVNIGKSNFSDIESSEELISLTELSKQYLSNMGRCVFHSSPQIVED